VAKIVELDTFEIGVAYARRDIADEVIGAADFEHCLVVSGSF
jgi:hypothetical protein